MPVLIKKKLVFIYPRISSFIRQDRRILQNNFNVIEYCSSIPIKILLPLELVRQFIFLIWTVPQVSIIVCHFAGYHSLIPVLLGKIFRVPVLVIVGGTDCVSFPSINYGNLRKSPLRWFTLKSLKYATHILTPSKSLVECDNTYSSTDGKKQGYHAFDPNIETPFTVIYNGIDTSRFHPIEGVLRRSGAFLTVCNYIDKRNFYLKGIDLVMMAAEEFPQFEFTILGKLDPHFQLRMPDNVHHVNFIPNEELPEKLSEYSFYLQLSLSEGFGVALAEAMACGCVPIVSKVGIMDFIVGDSGFVLDKYDRIQLFEIIRKATEADMQSLSVKACLRVSELFTTSLREKKLAALIEKLLVERNKANKPKKN